MAPRAQRTLGKGYSEVALGPRIVLKDHHIVVGRTFNNRGVNTTKSRVIEQFAGRERLKIFGRGIIKPHVVVVSLGPIGETSFHTRNPYNDSLLVYVIPKEFRCPHVDRQCVLHHGHEADVGPMGKVAALSIAETTVMPPAARPDQTVYAIRRTKDRRVAKYFLRSDFRLKEYAIHVFPMHRILAYDEPKPISGRFVKGGGDIVLLLFCHGRKRTAKEDECND